MTSKGCFFLLAVLCFAIAVFLGIAVALGSCCGVTIVSPQVSWGDRLLLFIPAGTAASLGLLFMYWALKERQG